MVPDELPDEMVAPGELRALARSSSACDQVGLRFGDSVVIQGAGGLGLQAAAVAKDMGAATVIVVDQIAGRLELARAFGADHTINLKEVPERRERVKLVRKWTGGVGADVACDFVGFPQVIPEGIEMLRAGGTYLEIGTISRGRQDRARAGARSCGAPRRSSASSSTTRGDPARARLPRPQPRALAVRPARLAHVSARADQPGLRRLGVARTRHHDDHARGASAMKELRRRLERERQAMAVRLRQLGGSITLEEAATPADSVWDEADHIQASEQRDMGLASRERLIERIERLTAALKRVEEGTYGTCVECGKSIAAARLKAIPEVATCVSCQEKLERGGEQ